MNDLRDLVTGSNGGTIVFVSPVRYAPFSPILRKVFCKVPLTLAVGPLLSAVDDCLLALPPDPKGPPGFGYINTIIICASINNFMHRPCLLYTSDAADE